MSEYLVIIFIAFAGFCLSAYLRHKKQRKTEHLVCPFRGNCTEVIQSRYAKFFGIPVEMLGLSYYSVVALGYGLSLLWTSPESAVVPVLLFFASTFALVFSFYLTFLQLVTLKKICTWCLLSATFCLSIFLLSLHAASPDVVPTLLQYTEVIATLHTLAMAFGLCASTFSDIFFFRFIQDDRISGDETSILHTFAQTIWLALGMMIMTGLALYLPQMAVYNASPAFLLEIVLVAVILINGSFLNLFVAPRFSRITSGEEHDHEDGELHKTKRLVFILGPISLVSWYLAFLLDSVGAMPFSFADGLIFYVFCLALSIFIGHVVLTHLDEKKSV